MVVEVEVQMKLSNPLIPFINYYKYVIFVYGETIILGYESDKNPFCLYKTIYQHFRFCKNVEPKTSADVHD